MEVQYGQQISRMRKSYGLTQAQFAKACGVGLASIQRYESNDRQPTIRTLEKMAAALHISVQNFLWADPRSTSNEHENYFQVEEKLRFIGYSFGFYEEDAMVWINYPEGTLEVSAEQIQQLNNASNTYFRFLLEELKKNSYNRFKPFTGGGN